MSFCRPTTEHFVYLNALCWRFPFYIFNFKNDCLFFLTLSALIPKMVASEESISMLIETKGEISLRSTLTFEPTRSENISCDIQQKDFILHDQYVVSFVFNKAIIGNYVIDTVRKQTP